MLKIRTQVKSLKRQSGWRSRVLDLLGGYGNEMRQRGGALTDLAKEF